MPECADLTGHFSFFFLIKNTSWAVVSVKIWDFGVAGGGG